MRKHLIIPIVTMVLALFVGLTARAQSVAYSNAVLSLGPVGYWPLQETAAPPLTPPTANNLGTLLTAANGAYIGGVFPGQTGALVASSDTSAFFDRASGEVQVLYNPSLFPPTFAAECWINWQQSNSTTEYILCSGDFGTPSVGAVNGSAGWRLRIASGTPTLLLYNENGTTASLTLNGTANRILSNQWYHLGISFDGTLVRMYTNGVQCNTGTPTVNATAGSPGLGFRYVPDDGSCTVTVGCSPDQTAFFQGNIDEVALYNNAAETNHFLAHYQNGTNTTPSQTYSSLVLADSPLVFFRLGEANQLPVAKNCSTNGYAVGPVGNGYYEVGTSPGADTGPAVLGSCVAAKFSPAGTQAVYAGLGVQAAPLIGAGVVCAPTNENFFNIVTNLDPAIANSNMTVLAWVKAPAGPVGWLQQVMGRNDGSSWRMNMSAISTNSSGTIQSNGFPDFVDGGLDLIGYENPINDGQWHFWAAVFNAPNSNASLYIDGALVAQLQETRPSFNNTSPFMIGCGPNDNGRNFVGSICGVALFTNTLTQAQIDSVYGVAYGGIIKQPPASVGYVAGTAGAVTLTCAAEGPSMQWFKGDPGSGVAVSGSEYSGATTENLVLTPPLVAGDLAKYYLEVYDGLGGHADSTAVTLAQVAVPTDAYATAALALNPIGYWPLNETSGRVAYNYAATGAYFNGLYAAAGGTPLQQNVAGPASLGVSAANVGVQFLPGLERITGNLTQSRETRTGVIVNSSSNYVLDITSNSTVVMWVQMPTGPSYGIQEVYGQQDSTIIRYSVFGANNAQIDYATDGTDTTGGPLMNDGLWHFWSASFNATNRLVSVYLDGNLINSGTTGSLPGFSAQATTFGCAPDDTGRNFIGSVCKVAAFPSVLTLAQIQSLFNVGYAGVLASPPSTVYYVTGTASASITATVEGSFIQWYRGTPGTGVALVNGGEISGVNTATLTFTPPSSGDLNATYYVVVGNGTTLANSTLTSTSTTATLTPLSLNGAFDNAVLALNPIAYWPLNETGGNIAYNYTPAYGSALNGTLQQLPICPNVEGLAGPPYLGFGANNLATGFSTSDGVSFVGTMNITGGAAGTGVLINSPILLVSNNTSVSAWIQIPLGLNVGNQGYVYGQSPDSRLIDFGVAGGANSQEWLSEGAVGSQQGGPTLNDGLWHFIVATYNKTNFAGVAYLDGKTNFTATYAAPGAVNPITGIGCSTSDTRNFNGLICKVATFTNFLTGAQVAALYNAAGIPPSFTLNPPQLVVANVGTVAALGVVNASGSTPLTYQWYYGTPGNSPALLTDGGRISGATSTSLVINPVQASDAGSYFVMAINPFASVPSSVVTLSTPSSVTDQVYAGRSPTFSVGPGAASYQWSSNGVPVSGATSSTFTLTNVTTGNSPVTVVCLINGTTSSATYTVNVIAAPTDAYAAAVLADNPAAFFRLNEADNGTGNNGAVAHDYASGNNGIYSNTVLAAPGFPYTAPLAANTDTAAQFGSLGASSLLGPSGYSNNFAGFIPLDFSLAVSNSPAYTPAEFSVEAWIYGIAGQHNGGIVTKGFGFGADSATPGIFEQFCLQDSDVGTSGSRLEFNVRDALGNRSTAQTGSGVIPNAPAWLHVVGVCDQANGTIGIFVNGQQLASAALSKSNGIMSTPVPVSIGAKQTTSSAGNYDGQWNGSVDEVAIYNKALTSNQVQAHYFAAGIAPIFIVSPTNGNNGSTNPPQGTTVTLHAQGFGTPPLTYQWYDYNGGSPVIWTGPGSTTPTLTLNNVSSSSPSTIGSGLFEVVIHNAYGSVNSADLNWLVSVAPIPGPPTLDPNLPATTFALAGTPVTFTVAANGTAPFTYSWTYNSGSGPVPVVNGGRISGATAPTLTIANSQSSDAGTYQVTVHNSIGTTPSVASALVVNNELGFNGGINWTLNSPSASASIADTVLQITTAVNNESNSFFFNTPMYVGAFQASFTYQNVTAAGADGFTFCLQNDPAGPAAVGFNGGGLGYRFITNSVAFAFNIYNGYTIGYAFSTEGVHNDGNSPGGGYTTPTPVSLRGGDPINITITYDGNRATLAAQDPSAGTSYSSNFVVGAVSQWLGSNTAYVGFTGSTGGLNTAQTISSFNYIPLPLVSAGASGSTILITWPTGVGGYVLQSASFVIGPWTTVPANSYTIVNGSYQLEVPVSNGTTFYRLKLTPP